MFGQIMRATTSLITTTSGRLFGESTAHTVSAGSHYAQAALSQAEVVANVTSGAVKIGATAVAVTLGAATAGTLVGASITVNAALSAIGYAAASVGAPAFVGSAISAAQGLLTSAGILSVMHPVKFVAGAGGIYTVLNGKMLVEGASEVAYAAKKQFDAVSDAVHGAVDSVKAIGYTVAGTGLKAIETLDRFAQVQDGFGEDGNTYIESINLAAEDAKLQGEIAQLDKDQKALNTGFDFITKSIVGLKEGGDHEIIHAVKAHQLVARNNLMDMQLKLNAKEAEIGSMKSLLTGWNLVEQADAPEAQKASEAPTAIADATFQGANEQANVEVIGNNKYADWDTIDLTASASAA